MFLKSNFVLSDNSMEKMIKVLNEQDIISKDGYLRLKSQKQIDEFLRKELEQRYEADQVRISTLLEKLLEAQKNANHKEQIQSIKISISDRIKGTTHKKLKKKIYKMNV